MASAFNTVGCCPARLLAGLLPLVLSTALVAQPPAGQSTSGKPPFIVSIREAAARGLLLDAARVGSALVAVGDRGSVIRSEDSGRTWQRAACPQGPALTGVAFASDGFHGWAVGHGGRILTTSDAGRSWQLSYEHPDKDASLLDVAALSPTHVIAVGAFGLALESRDAGKTWSSLSLPSADRHLNRIVLLAGDLVMIVGESGTLLRSPNAGDTWETLPSPYEGSLYGLTALPSGALLTHGLRGSLLLSPPLASPTSLPEWRRISTPAQGMLCTSISLGSGVVVAAGQARGFLLSRDNGASWKSWEPGVTTAIAELVLAPDGTLLAFGEAGVSALPLP